MTPVRQQFWQRELVTHYDSELVGWVLRGFQHGFRIGFEDSEVNLIPARGNMSSATQHPKVVTSYIQKELAAGHLLAIGPAELASQLGVHTSPLGVIPKKGRCT